MTHAMQMVTAFERGEADYHGGRRCCPFTAPHRVEAWRDGWLTAAAQRTAA